MKRTCAAPRSRVQHTRTRTHMRACRGSDSQQGGPAIASAMMRRIIKTRILQPPITQSESDRYAYRFCLFSWLTLFYFIF